MAASLNKVMLIGNLTRDPELRYTPGGQAVATFSIACNRVYNSQSGERKEEVSYIRIVAWARQAEICNEYLKKGSPVFVEGRLQSRSWEAQDGSKRSTIEVVSQNIQFLSTRGGGGSRQNAQPAGGDEAIFDGDTAPAGGAVPVSDKEMSPDEDIPF